MTAAISFSPATFFAAASDAGARAASREVDTRTDARDRALVRRISEGDALALRELMTHYAARLAQFAESFVDGSDAADDVVQDVFVWIWEHRTTLDVQTGTASYLYKATRNRALNASRSQRARHRLAGHMSADPPSHSINEGSARLDADSFHVEVRDMLRMVPPRCREIFLLVWGRDLSYAEVADILDVNVRTVQNQYYRAVAALARHFGVESPAP